MTTVCNVCWRNNPLLLAKQLSSLVRLSGDRVTAGLGMGGWPADYHASGVSMTGRDAGFDHALATLDNAWETSAPPRVLIGGTVDASFARAAYPMSDGWVAPLFGAQLPHDGGVAVRWAWSQSGRPGRPRIVTGRYVSLGPAAERTADEYIHHYYGPDYCAAARADTFTDVVELRAAVDELAEAGCDDLVLFPCSGDVDEVARVAEAVVEVSA